MGRIVNAIVNLPANENAWQHPGSLLMSLPCEIGAPIFVFTVG